MKIKNGREVLDYEGVFIEFEDEFGVGMFISEDKELDFREYEGVGESGEVEVEGKMIKWGILYS